MKVLFCTPYGDITKDNIGGISVWAKAIVSQYQRVESDIDLEVFALDRKTYVRGVNALVRLWTGIVEYVQLVRKVWKQIDAGAYDAIHLCSTASLSLIKDWLILGYAHRKGLKTFLHFHNGRVCEIVSRKNWESRLLRRVLKVVDVPIVMDAFSFNALGEWNVTTAVNLPNPLSSFVSESIASCDPLPERVKGRLLFVGHIVDIKGVYELVEACTRMPDVCLRMVGYAEEDVKQRLLTIASQREGDWLELTGGLSRENTIREILSADVLIAPSYMEGFPNVILEAMACGTPIIASRVGGIPEMLDNGSCGVLIEPRSVDAIVTAVESFVKDEQKKSECAQLGKERVNGMYSISSVWNQLTSIWRGV